MDLKLRLHDTLSGKLKPVVARSGGEVGVYCCGPTTYDVAHVGHARAALAPDIVVRHLRCQGAKVTYVRNVTDVDDKILKRAGERGEVPTELSARFAAEYQKDMRELGCFDPDVEPRVSQSIGDIIAIIEKLIAQGAAYEATMKTGARDVYYAVRSFAGYGKLSKRNLDEMRVGARVEASEDKRDPLDFALWKGCVGEAWGFESPWGKGRPGWHIECSAMADRHLGHGFEIHCGGMDLVFPHHENEIAQSEAAHPGEGDFAHIWMHNGFVNVDKEKMAKSLGNFVTVRQTYERNDPEALRYFLLGVHYRGPIAFDTEKLESGRVIFPGVSEAERRVDYLYQGLGRLAALANEAEGDVTAPAKMPKDLQSFVAVAKTARARVDEALDDDLNTPVALAVIGEVAKAANELVDLAAKRKKDKEIVRIAPFVAKLLHGELLSTCAPLGLLQTPPAEYLARTQERRLKIVGLDPEAIEKLLVMRADARQNKDFARGDAIRKELEGKGIEVADGPAGTTWRALA
jgi:cysteinyl-tRNA synthetase